MKQQQTAGYYVICIDIYIFIFFLLKLPIACLKGGLTHHFIYHNIAAKTGREIREDG